MLTVLMLASTPSQDSPSLSTQIPPSLGGVSSAITGTVFSLGTATVALGIRVLSFGVSLWIGLALLRGAIAVVGLDRRLASSSSAA